VHAVNIGRATVPRIVHRQNSMVYSTKFALSPQIISKHYYVHTLRTIIDPKTAHCYVFQEVSLSDEAVDGIYYVLVLDHACFSGRRVLGPEKK